ncbi:ATP-binding protein [Jatrophihabitans telluris]|uniref:histidine kinase n=1 Tax=Jatrophihabitans telluris TaxID=2038343 RepID=A0ABY4QUP1_9ACTN|nr:ATP-binding protein [Jatrophihabitans telluris]UQX86694.1 ATP-binding protein [Jatrophihabitans telluris]
MALLYGALVLLIGAALLMTSYILLDRALARNQVLQQLPPGPVTIIDSGGTRYTGWDPTQSQAHIRQDSLSYLLNNGLLYFGVIVLIGSIGGYLLARQALRPVARITATARRLSTKTLSERIGLGGPDDELRELADTFDDMLGRLDAAFSSQRRFVANASHELRTPLAVIQTELDVTLSDPKASVEDLRRMGEVLRDATNRAQRLADALLALARLQGREGQGLEVSEAITINDLIPNAVAAAESEAATRGIVISSEGEAVRTTGDPRLLERVIGNLVENAVRYNVPGGWVRIEVSHDVRGGFPAAIIVVSNSGVAVAPEEVEGLFDAFRRGGRARTQQRGAGLGLSIVKAIVDAHHGAIRAEAQPAGGLRVEIALPLTTTPVAAHAAV